MRNRPQPRRTWGHTSSYGFKVSWCTPFKAVQQEDVQLRALLLAAMHTYHSRIGTAAQRSTYRASLCAELSRHGHQLSQQQLMEILEREQTDYLSRMELPAGIAVNAALRENVFVSLVCILNKIPLFLVSAAATAKPLCLLTCKLRQL